MHRNFVSTDSMGCMSKIELRVNKSNFKVWYFQVTTTKKAMQIWETDFHKHILIPSFHIYTYPIRLYNRPFFFVFFFACLFLLFSVFKVFQFGFSHYKTKINWPSMFSLTVPSHCCSKHKRIKASRWALNYSLYENALARGLKQRPILSTCGELMLVEMRSLKTTVLALDCWQENVLWGTHFKGLSESSLGLCR